MRVARSWLVLPAGVALLAACELSAPAPAPTPITAAVLPNEPEADQRSASHSAAVDWAGAGDCLDQLKLVHALAARGQLDEAHAPPFALAPSTSPTGLDWVRADMVPLVTDLPLEAYEDQAAAAAAAPCLLLVGQPSEVRAAHRVVDYRRVASEYQSGVRSEKNPDYDAAQARVREAERGTRARRPGIMRVGDPLLDLVGLLVGGVIATFDQVGGDDDLDQALAALKETPRSRDRPVYRAYEFERSTVRAGKEATIGVVLRDQRRGRIWRSEVRQREMRPFDVLEGLDPRDRDYEQHRAGALSWEEFEHWQRQPPQLPVSALVAALVDGGRASEAALAAGLDLFAEAPPRVALAARPVAELVEQDYPAELPEADALAPGGGPDYEAVRSEERSLAALDVSAPATEADGWMSGAVEQTVLATARDPRLKSVVRLDAGGRRGSGFYVGEHLVVTGMDLVGHTSVIDVTTSEGEAVLGLVVHKDPRHGLAVVHVPRAGVPALLAGPPAPGPGWRVDVLEVIGRGQGRVTRAVRAAGDRVGSGALRIEGEAGEVAASAGAPVFLEDRVVAVVGAGGAGAERGLIPVAAVSELLRSDTLAALR